MDRKVIVWKTSHSVILAFAKIALFVLAIFMVNTSVSFADWVGTPTNGIITKVRTYQLGQTGDFRAQITVSGAAHNCGTQPNIFYFDTNKIPAEVVKAVLSLAFGAMVSGKEVNITYDCAITGGGYGWGVALTVIK